MTIKISDIPFEEDKDQPKTLYKYRTWTDKWHKTILTEQTIYLARPTSFADPKDCRIFKRDDLLSPKDIYDKYYYGAKAKNKSWDELDCRKYATEWFLKSAMHDKNYIRDHQEKYFKKFNEKLGILCLTENPLNHKMWLEYADYHKGFCVGFNSLNLFKHLGGGMKVLYYDTLPDIQPFASPEEQYIIQVFSKEKKWNFEQEYRTLMFWKNPATEKERTKIIPNDCYKEIIFGSEMDEGSKKEIIKLCANKGLSVSFYQEKYNSANNMITFAIIPIP